MADALHSEASSRTLNAAKEINQQPPLAFLYIDRNGKKHAPDHDTRELPAFSATATRKNVDYEIDKENSISGHINTSSSSSTYHHEADWPTPTSALTMLKYTRMPAGKASSSLAASRYQACGYLPAYKGIGKAHTALIYRQNGCQPPYHQARVNLPSVPTHRDHTVVDSETVVGHLRSTSID